MKWMGLRTVANMFWQMFGIKDAETNAHRRAEREAERLAAAAKCRAIEERLTRAELMLLDEQGAISARET